MGDILKAICDEMVTFLTLDCITNVPDSDPTKAELVDARSALQEDVERVSPSIIVYPRPEETSELIEVFIGGGQRWRHHFLVETGFHQRGVDRDTAWENAGRLRRRVVDSILSNAALSASTPDETVTVEVSPVKTVSVKERGGEKEWIWEATVEVAYETDYTT